MKISLRIQATFLSILCSFIIIHALHASCVQKTERIYTHKDMDIVMMESCPPYISLATSRENTIHINAETTEIALDMDGVVLDLKPYDKYVSTIWENREVAGNLAIECVKESARWFFNGNKKGKALTLVSSINLDNGDATKTALKEYQQGLEKIVDNVIDKKCLKTGIIKILCALNGHSFIMRPVTNQPLQEYGRIATRLPEAFEMLSPGSHGFLNEQQKLIQKPSLDYFKAYIEEYNIKSHLYNPNGQRLAVFIDDRIENVRAAAEAGLIAIHFVGINQLIEDLESLGLPTPSRLNNF